MSVELLINGQVYQGWESVRITRGIEQVAGDFSLAVTDRWSDGGELRAWPLNALDACQVRLDGVPVIAGYLDAVSINLDAGSHGVSVQGRDKTGDLVDCSAVHAGQWRDATVERIARDLCKPFGVAVVMVSGAGEPLKSFAIQEGESVFEALDRAARSRALLLTSDPEGRLVITRRGAQRVPVDVVEGVNLLSGSAEYRVNERFSSITVKGQARGSDEQGAEPAATVKAKVTDAEITRHRPLVVIAEEQGGSVSARADWERRIRMGRGSRATVSVQGWSHTGGLWLPNRLVRVKSPSLRVDADLLIVACTYTLDGGGSRTEMQLAHPSAFDQMAGVKSGRLASKIDDKNGAAIETKDGLGKKK
jgi:prophage tail gpP-like protein